MTQVAEKKNKKSSSFMRISSGKQSWLFKKFSFPHADRDGMSCTSGFSLSGLDEGLHIKTTVYVFPQSSKAYPFCSLLILSVLQPTLSLMVIFRSPAVW